jgi:hypothetical protein
MCIHERACTAGGNAAQPITHVVPQRSLGAGKAELQQSPKSNLQSQHGHRLASHALWSGIPGAALRNPTMASRMNGGAEVPMMPSPSPRRASAREDKSSLQQLNIRQVQ